MNPAILKLLGLFVDQRFIRLIDAFQKDKDMANDAHIVASSVKTAAENVAQAPGTDKSLKSGLENLSYITDLAMQFFKDGSVSKKSMAWLSFNYASVGKKFKLLKPLGDKDNATAIQLRDELAKQPEFAGACLRLMNKMEGEAFKGVRNDETMARDAAVITETMRAAVIKVSCHDTDECRAMKPALENIGNLLGIATGYIKDGTIPEKSIFDTMNYLLGVRDNVTTLETLKQKDHPVANMLRDEIMGAPGFTDACRGLMSKTEGSVFRIEPVEDGGAQIRELMTGKDLVLIRMKAEHYAELQKAIGKPPSGNDQKKPTGPAAPKL